MQFKILLVLVIITVIPTVLSLSKRLSRLQSDPLSKTRCDLLCYDVSKETKAQCRSRCRSQESKPGTCPVADSPKWAAACVKACTTDAQCDGTQRCCLHDCSSVCSEPLDLLTLPGLPALPLVEEVKEKKRSVIIRWSDGIGDTARAVPGRVLYLLEEQHHLGPKYEEPRLGEWNLLLRTNKTKVSLRNSLKPGRWYRFRVASVSATGSRGFSQPSDSFTPRKGPRAPPPPKKLKVHPMRSENGTVTVRLDWKEPKSDLPVVRYKVFWSRRVRGLSGELDSVLVDHQTVSKEQNSIEIKDLQPNSMYFLQVQTISQFGLGKLRSDKASILFNTTTAYLNQLNESPPESLQRRERKIKGLKLQKVIWYNNKLKAKIAWEPVFKSGDQARRYYVNWYTEKCEDPKKKRKEWSATTEKNVFEISNLDYKCHYKVHINKTNRPKTPDSELTIIIPGCDYFQRRTNNSLRC